MLEAGAAGGVGAVDCLDGLADADDFAAMGEHLDRGVGRLGGDGSMIPREGIGQDGRWKMEYGSRREP